MFLHLGWPVVCVLAGALVLPRLGSCLGWVLARSWLGVFVLAHETFPEGWIKETNGHRATDLRSGKLTTPMLRVASDQLLF